MKFIKIKKFKEYQHYHHRNIFWIKLHLQMLDNLDFWGFEDWEKWLWVGLLMLAGKLNNEIPYNEEFLKSKLAIKTTKPLKNTIDKFFSKKMLDIADESIDIGIDIGIAQIREEKRREEKKEHKDKYLDFVFLTEEEHKKLIADYEKDVINDYIERLNNHIGSKGKKYKNHYFTILNWLRRGNVEKKVIHKDTRSEAEKKCEAEWNAMTPDEQKRRTTEANMNWEEAIKKGLSGGKNGH